MRGRGFEGFILLGEQEILRTFGTLIHFETEIPRLLDRARAIGSGGSKECGLLAMLNRDKYQEFRQLGWINQSYNLLKIRDSDIPIVKFCQPYRQPNSGGGPGGIGNSDNFEIERILNCPESGFRIPGTNIPSPYSMTSRMHRYLRQQ